MNAHSHIRVAAYVASGVPELAPHFDDLAHGVVAPDRVRGHRGTRHHALGRNLGKWRHLAFSSRWAYLLGQGGTAAYRLGKYLHYVADEAVPFSGTTSRHNEYESAIGYHIKQMVGDAPSPAACIGGRWDVYAADTVAPRQDFFGRVRIVPPSSAARKILDASTVVARAVFAPRNHPIDVEYVSGIFERCRACEEGLRRTFAFRRTDEWYAPVACPVMLVWSVIYALSAWPLRQFWFVPWWGVVPANLLHIGQLIALSAWLWSLLAHASAVEMQGFICLTVACWLFSVGATAAWGWALKVGPSALVTWSVIAGLTGPLVPLVMAAVALVLRCQRSNEPRTTAGP